MDFFRSHFVFERIENRNGQRLKIPDIAGYDSHPMNDGCGGNQAILNHMIRTAMHEAAPFPEYIGIGIKTSDRSDDHLQPMFYLVSLPWIVLTRHFNTGLNLSGGNAGKMQRRTRHGCQPGQYCPMRLAPSKLGQNVGIQYIHRISIVEVWNGPALPAASHWSLQIEPWSRAEKQFLQIRLGSFLEVFPFIERDQYRFRFTPL